MASSVSTYTVNRLNQYSQRTVPDQVDVFGIANPTANVTVRVIGGTTYTAVRKGEYYHHPLTVGNNVYPEIEVKSLYGATLAQTNRVFNPPATETFSHDADGNLTSDGRWTYTWDAENRLIAMIRDTGTPAGARQWLRFEYDHQGRRVRKRFETNNGSGWVLSSDTAFAYDGWNLVAELNAASSNARLRTYLWGIDLSGQAEPAPNGAGGVGGLLLVTDYVGGTTYHWPAYDGNGNVAALVAEANGSLSARYEYGPFGETLRATGAMAKKNPLRFSTKYTDDQTGFLYYGYRFYNPTTGRWISRDPSEEKGGANLYNFLHNEPVARCDYLGLNPVEDAMKFWTRVTVPVIVSDLAFIVCDCWAVRDGDKIRFRRTPGATLLMVTPIGASIGVFTCEGPFKYYLMTEWPPGEYKCRFSYVIVCLNGPKQQPGA